jgi:transposase
LQLITRRIRQLDTERTRKRNRQKAALRLGTVGQIIANDTQVNINHIERRISRLEDAALKLVNDTPEHEVRLDLLKSVTGIADKSGMRLLAVLASLPGDMSSAQWVTHAGLDPHPYESGTSTNKPRRITKAGNRYLRDALYMPALVASQKDPHVSAYYNALLNRGKKPMQAIVAVMRKLLICIWGMFKHDQYWVGEKLYKIA